MQPKEQNPRQRNKMTEDKTETTKKEENKEAENETKEAKIEEKKELKKEIPKIKKEKAIAVGKNLHLSTKDAAAICKFIRNKKIGNAIKELEQVVLGKKAVPMKGEIPHRKGKGMMSGRYPKESAKHFIILLKNLAENSAEFDEPIITGAFANMGSRPHGRFGRIRRKRTHIQITAKDKLSKEGKK